MKIKVTSPSFSKNQYLREILLHTFNDVVFNEDGVRFQEEALVNYLKDAEGAIIGLEKIDRFVLEALPDLRIISKYGVGLDNIDLESAQALGKKVGWTGGVNRRSVAEQTLAFMIGLCRNLFTTSYSLNQGIWNKEGGEQLSGKTVGLIGCGHIGKEVLQLLQPFGCQILICDILDKSEIVETYHAKQVSLQELLIAADVISLHVPLTELTFHLIGEEQLHQMKPSAYLINTSRGSVINQGALKQALANQIIAGAALDVFEEEPPSDQEFLSLPNLVATPHIGGNAREAVKAMGENAIGHLKQFFGK